MIDLDTMTIPELRRFIHMLHTEKKLPAPVAMHAALLVGYAQLVIRMRETTSAHFAKADIQRELDELYTHLPEDVQW